MSKFYLLYHDEDKLKHIDNKGLPFNDISEIDLMTIKYNKPDFITYIKNNYNIDLNDKDIYIAKVTLNKSDNYYNVTLYNPIFQTNKGLAHNRLVKIESVILNRLDKVVKKEKIKLLDESSQYRSLISSMCEEIVTTRKLQEYMSDENNSKLCLKLRDEISELFGADYNFHVSRIWKNLINYMEFRTFLLEYLSYFHKDLKQKIMPAENYLLPSELFNYQWPFYISPYDANKDVNKDIEQRYMDEESYNLSMISYIKTSPFDDEEIGHIYKKYGLNQVMNYFDANRIYSSSKEDLLRLGIINEEDYIKNNKELNIKK